VVTREISQLETSQFNSDATPNAIWLFKNRNTQNKRQERMQQREKEIQKNISFILAIKMIRRKKRKKEKGLKLIVTYCTPFSLRETHPI